MTETIWVGVSAGVAETRVLVNDGATTLLKARLLATPAHPRALQWFLEALALWQGMRVRAVLSAAAPDDASEVHFHRDWFPDFGDPLYAIEWTDRARPLRRRDELGGLGDFRDLKQLHLFDALESGQ